MKCPRCNTSMIIDAWNGWIWYCYNCDYEGDRANDKEIEEFEKDMERVNKSVNICN